MKYLSTRGKKADSFKDNAKAEEIKISPNTKIAKGWNLF